MFDLLAFDEEEGQPLWLWRWVVPEPDCLPWTDRLDTMLLSRCSGAN